MNPSPHPSRKKNLVLAIRLAGTLISTALFVWLLSRQKWDVLLDKAAGIAFWALLLAAGFYLLSYGFNTLRWCLLLWAQNVKITFFQAYRLTWAGNFASNFLPSTIGGDGFRMLSVHPYTGSKSISIGSVALDRIINMAAMACLIPAPLIIFGNTMREAIPAPAWGAVTLPFGLRKLFEKFFPKVVAAFQAWAAKPAALVYAFLAAWPSNLLPMAATYLLARQLGMNVTPWQVIGVQTVTYFLSVLPISVNGYGLREVAYTTLYSALGSTLEQASTLALVTRFLTVISTVPGALWLSSVVINSAALDENS
ncbi:MAG: lysylphosphatidylglycerol synthase transmembrane domain-containing protein [Chloroflexi bacterium]|nr:lysylphosphatidylglycerol synthase transmembrane domain-containing protein [Chloroflexota bacterium]